MYNLKNKVRAKKLRDGAWLIMKSKSYRYKAITDEGEGIISHLVQVAKNEQMRLDPENYQRNKKGNLTEIVLV